MTGKAEFNVDEWDLLRSSPLMASLLVVAASPSGPVGLVQESTAARDVIRGAAETAQTPLLKTLSDDIMKTMAIPRPPAGTTAAQVQDAASEILKRTATLLEGKATTEETGEVKEWLMKVAQATAEAAKEGGFLGIGGVAVSPEETAALLRIKSALGLAA